MIEGMSTLGLNPRDIKYVLISHAHGDHDQGAALLQSRYGATIVMGCRRLGGDASSAPHPRPAACRSDISPSAAKG
jgi:metallo-beta-lactamase class B